MAAKGWHKNENLKFQSKSLAAGQFGQFYSAGTTGPVSSESLKNPAESRTVRGHPTCSLLRPLENQTFSPTML